MTTIPGRRSAVAAVLAGLVAVVALGAYAVLRDDEPGRTVMDDFESGALTGWHAVSSGNGGWGVYAAGGKAADPVRVDPNAPLVLPDPPQGRFAAATTPNGPGTRILYRDVRLDGRLAVRMNVFYAGTAFFRSPGTLAWDGLVANQQFRIDLLDPSAPIDSVAGDDVLVNVFRTSPGDSVAGPPTPVRVDVSRWAGRVVRLRIAATDNRGPLRVGVDNIRFEPAGVDGKGRIELPETPKATSAINLVLRRLSEAEALAAVEARAERLARANQFSGAVLVTRAGNVLLEKAWGLADRETRTANTPDTKFRLGSMNKMFTAVATLQLVEAGKLALGDPVGKYLPDYPNKEVAKKVTVRHLLTHTGGTGDFFGAVFDQNRLKLRRHDDYVKLFGSNLLEFEPGARFEYSNYGFILLGAIIEAATGQSYYEYVREHVFRPAGMTATDSLPESVNVPKRATGYLRPPGRPWEPNTNTLPWRGTSAGGGYSTVRDLMRFAQALTSGKLISKASLAEATREHEPGYGYGFGVQGEGPLRSFGHGGGAPGMNGELRIYPRLGYVVVGLSNLDPPAASQLVEFFALRMPDK